MGMKFSISKGRQNLLILFLLRKIVGTLLTHRRIHKVAFIFDMQNNKRSNNKALLSVMSKAVSTHMHMCVWTHTHRKNCFLHSNTFLQEKPPCPIKAHPLDFLPPDVPIAHKVYGPAGLPHSPSLLSFLWPHATAMRVLGTNLASTASMDPQLPLLLSLLHVWTHLLSQ